MPYFSTYITPRGGGGGTSVINPGAVATSPFVINSPDGGDNMTISVANTTGETTYLISDNVSTGAGHSFRAGNGSTTPFEFRTSSTVYFTVNNSEPKVRISSSTVVNFGWSDWNFERVAAGVASVREVAAGAGGWLKQPAGESFVATDVTNNTITPAAITGLSATVKAGRRYAGELVLYCEEATAADGLRLDYDGGTATMTSFLAQGFLSDDNGFQAVARTTALATDTTNTTVTGPTLVRVSLEFVVNAAGTFIPRAAKEADAAGANLTITAGSHMVLRDIT